MSCWPFTALHPHYWQLPLLWFPFSSLHEQSNRGVHSIAAWLEELASLFLGSLSELSPSYLYSWRLLCSSICNNPQPPKVSHYLKYLFSFFLEALDLKFPPRPYTYIASPLPFQILSQNPALPGSPWPSKTPMQRSSCICHLLSLFLLSHLPSVVHSTNKF